MGVELLALDDSHGEGIVSLMAEIFESTPQATWFAEKPSEEQLKGIFAQKLASKKQETLIDNVAVLNGKVIGDCEILIEKGTGILGIIIDPKYQGSGVGRSLLLRCLREARILNVKFVVAEVQRENQGVLGFFLKHGFAIDSAAPISTERNGKKANVIRLVLAL